MIKSFKHKGLESFNGTGIKAGIVPRHADKIARILDRLDSSTGPQDMNLPGYKLHRLKGSGKDTWSISVSGNWRITFKFQGEDAILLDYLDYH